MIRTEPTAKPFLEVTPGDTHWANRVGRHKRWQWGGKSLAAHHDRIPPACVSDQSPVSDTFPSSLHNISTPVWGRQLQPAGGKAAALWKTSALTPHLNNGGLDQIGDLFRRHPLAGRFKHVAKMIQLGAGGRIANVGARGGVV